MNDYDDALPEPGDDPLLEEVVSHLKRLEPPLEARIANRRALAGELSSFNNMNQRGRLPWWRRSISIPVPIAASLVVLAALALASSFRGWQERSTKHVEAPNQLAENAADARAEETAIAKRKPDAHAVSRFYETETYLCGIGRVNSESRYFIKE